MIRSCFRWLLAFVVLMTVLSGSVFSQGQMQVNIFFAGLNIGMIEEGIELRGLSPELIRDYSRLRDNAAACLDLIIAEFRAPFDPSALKQVVRQVRSFDFASTRMNDQHKAVFFNGTLFKTRTSLALTFGMRGQGAESMNAEPTCDSSLLECGYFMGKAYGAAFMKNRIRQNAARSGLNNAISKGINCAQRLGCTFPTSEQWRSLGLNAESTAEDYQRAFPKVRDIILNRLVGAGGPFMTPSSPPALLVSGSYQVSTTATAGSTYTGVFRIRVNGGRITGTSDWTCCPGPRHDPLSGRIAGNQVTIERNCSGQGASGACRQVYTGTISGDTISGRFTHNGVDAGTWVLRLR